MGQQESQLPPPSGKPGLKFHKRHGGSCKLSGNNQKARRANSTYCDAILFSDRPVLPGEAVLLRVTEVCKGWTGTLKLGFTAHNPEDIASLPKSTSPALTRKAGHWAKSPPTRLIKPGALLHYYYLSNGQVCYGVGGKEKGTLMSEGIDPKGPLWCLIDLYGSCSAIELEETSTVEETEEEPGQSVEATAPPMTPDMYPTISKTTFDRQLTPPPSYENLFSYRGTT